MTCRKTIVMAQAGIMDVKLIRAFIASPSGLEPERRIAHAIAEHVNKTVAKELGGRLELFGWEETISGSGRPQAIINAEMESCELFIGAMWANWGSPPDHGGSYSSDFEEEFELSRARHEKTGSPTMSMYFKAVDPMQMRDPGDDLKKVIAFQTKLRTEKRFLYDTFDEPNDFADKIRSFLTVHTIRLLREMDRPAIEERVAKKPSEGQVDSRAAEVSDGQADRAETSFLVSIAPALGADPGPSPAQVARLRLIGMVCGTDANDKLGLAAHDANLLYNERANFSFSDIETRGLLRTGLAELGHENVPVWTWLTEATQGRTDRLTMLTLLGEEAARAGAIEAMFRLYDPNKPPAPIEVEIVEDFWLEADAPNLVKQQALRYLKAYGGAEHLPAIDKEADRADKDNLKLAQEAALAILVRTDSAAAANRLLTTSFETIDETLRDPAIALLDEVGSELLRLGLDHRSPDVRRRSVELLSERGALDLDTIHRARDDDAPRVRLVAIYALERLDQPLSLDEARKILGRPKPATYLLFSAPSLDGTGISLFDRYRANRLRHMPIAAVKALLTDSEHRHAAYLALAARRIEDFPAQLRRDLADEFQEYTARYWPDGLRGDMRPTAALLTIGTSDPLEAKRRDLVRDALNVIAGYRNEQDIELIRLVLKSGFVGLTPTTVAYLQALGGETDIPLLGKVTPFSFFDLAHLQFENFDIAVRAILRLNIGSFMGLMTSALSDEVLARLIDLYPSADFARLPENAILELLLSEVAVVRRAAARKVPTSLARSKVRKLLEAYRDDPNGRYYVVSHWLDLGLGLTRAQARLVVAAKP